MWGAIWGSFLNVVIHRLPRGESLAHPPSHCPHCQTPIRWFENVPIVSYLALRGRCRHCESPIKARYLIVELLTAGLSLALFLKCAEGRWETASLGAIVVPFLFLFVFIGAAIAIGFIDLELALIPDHLTVPTAALGIIYAIVAPRSGAFADFHPAPTWQESVIGLVVGAGLILSIYVVYRLLTGRVGMGGGDVTVTAMIGAYFGWRALLFIVLFASMQGLLVAIALGIMERVRGRPSALLLRGVSEPSYWEDGHPLASRPTPPSASRPEGRAENPASEASEADHDVDPSDRDSDGPAPPDEARESAAESELSDTDEGGGEGPSEPAGENGAEETSEAPAAPGSDFAQSQEESFGKLGIPFGPFLALAGVEYIFLGGLFERWFLLGGY